VPSLRDNRFYQAWVIILHVSDPRAMELIGVEFAPNHPAPYQRPAYLDEPKGNGVEQPARPSGRRRPTWWTRPSRAHLSPGGAPGPTSRRPEACFRCARMSRRRGSGQGCTGRREPAPPTGVAIFENVFGVVIIGTEIRGLPSCSSGTSPKAPGGSDHALVERAPRRHDCPA
jgi:hypothetical protein